MKSLKGSRTSHLLLNYLINGTVLSALFLLAACGAGGASGTSASLQSLATSTDPFLAWQPLPSQGCFEHAYTQPAGDAAPLNLFPMPVSNVDPTAFQAFFNGVSQPTSYNAVTNELQVLATPDPQMTIDIIYCVIGWTPESTTPPVTPPITPPVTPPITPPVTPPVAPPVTAPVAPPVTNSPPPPVCTSQQKLAYTAECKHDLGARNYYAACSVTYTCPANCVIDYSGMSSAHGEVKNCHVSESSNKAVVNCDYMNISGVDTNYASLSCKNP